MVAKLRGSGTFCFYFYSLFLYKKVRIPARKKKNFGSSDTITDYISSIDISFILGVFGKSFTLTVYLTIASHVKKVLFCITH